MTKQKVTVAVGVLLGAVLLAGGGFWLGRGHLFSKSAAGLDDGAASINDSAGSGTEPLGQDQSASDTSGLSVTSSGAMDLGQLGNTKTGAQGSTVSSGGNSSGGVPQIDPSTFAAYEKYKDQSHALFGEVQKGSGDELTAGKKAAVYYKGWLTNGQMFDQSRAGSDGKLQPFIFTLGAHAVIPGWEEGVAGMKVGGTRLIIVPPAVGYGSTAQNGIPANSVLVFEVQLLEVQ